MWSSRDSSVPARYNFATLDKAAGLHARLKAAETKAQDEGAGILTRVNSFRRPGGREFIVFSEIRIAFKCLLGTSSCVLQRVLLYSSVLGIV